MDGRLAENSHHGNVWWIDPCPLDHRRFGSGDLACVGHGEQHGTDDAFLAKRDDALPDELEDSVGLGLLLSLAAPSHAKRPEDGFHISPVSSCGRRLSSTAARMAAARVLKRDRSLIGRCGRAPAESPFQISIISLT
jgi:hypothetical protein